MFIDRSTFVSTYASTADQAGSVIAKSGPSWNAINPEYVARIARVPFDEFVQGCRETLDANALLRRFVELVCG